MTINTNMPNDGAVAAPGKLIQFDGGAGDFLGTQILGWLITACPLGIC